MTDLIVDSNSIYARSWYAVNGNPRDCLIGTLQMSLMCLNPKRNGSTVDRVLFCWDAGQKKNKERALRPAEYNGTKDDVMACLEALYGAQSVCMKPYEADDLIATAATHSAADHVIVATGDKDLWQLNSHKVSIFDIASKGIIGRREILSKWHIKRPIQLAIALAIQGDSSDKISGIKGWGEKKVIKLFEAVTPDQDFEQALQTILDQIPEDRQGEFWEALDLTLLDCDIQGVPEPTSIVWADPDTLYDQGMGDIVGHYTQVYNEYMGIDTEESVIEAVSTAAARHRSRED